MVKRCIYLRVRKVATSVSRCEDRTAHALISFVNNDMQIFHGVTNRARISMFEGSRNRSRQTGRTASYDCKCFHALIIAATLDTSHQTDRAAFGRA